jgi:hypothetical protein
MPLSLSLPSSELMSILTAQATPHAVVSVFSSCGLVARTLTPKIVLVHSGRGASAQYHIECLADVTCLAVVPAWSESCALGCLLGVGMSNGDCQLWDPCVVHAPVATVKVSKSHEPVIDLKSIARGNDTLLWALCTSSMVQLQVSRPPDVTSFSSAEDTSSRLLRQTKAAKDRRNPVPVDCVVTTRVKVDNRPLRLLLSARSSEGLGAIVGGTRVVFVQGLHVTKTAPHTVASIEAPNCAAENAENAEREQMSTDFIRDVFFDAVAGDVAWIAFRNVARKVDLALDGRTSREILWCTRPCEYVRMYPGTTLTMSRPSLDEDVPAVPSCFSLDSDDRLTAWYPGGQAFDSYSAPIITMGSRRRYYSVAQHAADLCTFLVAFEDGGAAVWTFDADARLWSIVATFDAPPAVEKLASVAGDPEGLLVIAERGATLKLLHLPTGVCVRSITSAAHVTLKAAVRSRKEFVWLVGEHEGLRGAQTNQVLDVDLPTGELRAVLRPTGGALQPLFRSCILDASGERVLFSFEGGWEVWDTRSSRCVTSAPTPDDVALVAWSPVGRAIDDAFPATQCVAIVEKSGSVRFRDATGKSPAAFRNASFHRQSDHQAATACAVSEFMVIADVKGHVNVVTVRPAGQQCYINSVPTVPAGAHVAAMLPVPGAMPPMALVAIRFTSGAVGVWDVGSRVRLSYKEPSALGGAKVIDFMWLDAARLALLSADGTLRCVHPVSLEADDVRHTAPDLNVVGLSGHGAQGWRVGLSWHGALSAPALPALFDASCSATEMLERLVRLTEAIGDHAGASIFQSALRRDYRRPLDVHDVASASRAELTSVSTTLSNTRLAQAHELSTTQPLSGRSWLTIARSFLRTGDLDSACGCLLSLELEDPMFESSCNLACAIASSSVSSDSDIAVLTAKRAAARLIVAGRVDEAIDKFAMMGQHRDGAEALISKGRFIDAVLFSLLSSPDAGLHRHSRAVLILALLERGDYTNAARTAIACGEYVVALACVESGAMHGALHVGLAWLVAAWVASGPHKDAKSTAAMELASAEFRPVFAAPCMKGGEHGGSLRHWTRSIHVLVKSVIEVAGADATGMVDLAMQAKLV